MSALYYIITNLVSHTRHHYLQYAFMLFSQWRSVRMLCRNLIILTRYREYVWAVVILTCLGVVAARGISDWRFVLVLCANALSIAFAFMINDIEDAHDDMRDEAKKVRNPISAKKIPPHIAWIATFIICLSAFSLYAALGRSVLIIGSTSLLLGFLYSWKPIRLKSIPLLDVLSHCLMLAGLPYAAAFTIYAETIATSYFLWPFLSVIAFSAYGELYNELRDQKCDDEAGIRHTAALLGSQNANLLMILFGIVGFTATFVSAFVKRIVPMEALVLFFGVTSIFLMYAIYRIRGKWSWMKVQVVTQHVIQITTALTLITYLVLFSN